MIVTVGDSGLCCCTCVKYRRYRGDLTQVFQIINGIDNLKFEDFFTTTKLDSTRNSEHKLYVHFTKTKTRKFAFSNRVAPTWNSLLPCTKKSTITSLSLLDKDPNLLGFFLGGGGGGREGGYYEE